ncbi:MAG TPA: GMC family oxidoreductase N-terminal domain-containing protein [Solirubrobacterales bacterium]|nr:GMC family oxidoreductase N-terminal domain-containing protein [Solirubrobacterales bacterium]
MAPGIDGLPAAERDLDVSGPVAQFLRSLSPRVLLRMRLGLRAFEWLPFPWRFSRLEPEAAEDFLRKLDSSRFPLHHDLLLLAKILSTLGYAVAPEVEARIGTEIGCATADGTLPEPAGSLGETEAHGEGEECEVAIIGSGAGGAVAAALLAEAGLDVLVLEAGDHYNRDNYPAGRLEAISKLYREAGLTIAEGSPPIPVPVAKVVGGTTVINSGTCFRAPDSILDGWQNEFGIPWARELDADFAEAEDFLRVTQLDPNRMGRNGQLAMEGAEALGVSGGPIHRNAGNCVQCSSCPYGCAIDAKRGMHVSYLPRAVAAGARVRSGVEAQRVLVEDGRAVGLACSARDESGRQRPFTVRARRAVIAAGGAFGTPELLLRSGLGGSQVGRNLRIHPACWVGGRYEEEVRGWDGVMQSFYVDQWEHSQRVLLEATFTPLAFGGAWLVGTGREHQRSMLNFGHIGSIGVQIRDLSAGSVGLANEGALRASYKLGGEDSSAVLFGIARAAEIHFAAGASEVYPNIPRVGTLKPKDLPQFEATRFKPSELRLEAFHPMGTARIAADPRRGVCAPDGSVNGTPGLYVADASLLPTAPGVNPMMTIIAFAKQVARGVATEAADRPAPSSAAAEAVA